MKKLSEENILKFEKFVNEIMEQDNAKGIAIKAFFKSGETIYEKYFGYKNIEKKLQIDQNTIFGVGSITKSFVALSILQLVEEGKLSLEDPISKHIKYFTNKNNLHPILIKHFLTHTPGFFPLKRTTIDNILQKFNIEDNLENEIIYNNDFAEESLKEIIEQINNETEFIGRPGEYFSYCNDGYGILSEIVHKISGMPFAKYVEEKIIKPLNMNRTNCSFVRNPLDENCSTLYTLKKEKWTIDMNFKNNAFALNGAGSIKSTISDMTEYLLMLLNEGQLNEKKIIDKFFIKELIKPRIFVNHNVYYCYGFKISEIENRRYIGHSGSLPGVSANISFCPEEQLGIIVLCNTMDVSVDLLSNALFNLIIGKKELIENPKLQQIMWDEDTQKEVQGEYISREDEEDNFTIEKKENSFYLKRYGKEREVIPVFYNEALVKGKLKDNFLFLIKNDENKIFAARFGNRILKKSKK
jgi:CubicO group peptidase (beta-lactamase class C family)